MMERETCFLATMIVATTLSWHATISVAADPLPVPERGFVSSRPAKTWEEGLLSGNGTIGANALSRPRNERIIFTHERLFLPMGAPVMPLDQSARLFEIRRLIDVGPTLVSRAGIEVPANMQGFDMILPTDRLAQQGSH